MNSGDCCVPVGLVSDEMLPKFRGGEFLGNDDRAPGA